MNQKPQLATLLFFLLLVLLAAWYYHFDQILFFGPQSVHIWRQADCTSITLNYMQEGRGLFHPATHYIGLAGNGEMISDFPILYYIVGNIWKVSGQQEWIYRLIVFLLFVGGLTAIYLVLIDWYNDFMLAASTTLLIYTSPVIVYYSCNFLMNIVSFAFALMALSSFYWYYKTTKVKWLWISALFYLIGGLIKIPALITFVIILFIYLSEVAGLIQYRKDHPIFPNKWKNSLPFIMVILLVALWVKYVTIYNRGNGGLFLVGIYPIWDLSWPEIKKIYDSFIEYWYGQHFHMSMHIATLLVFVWIIFRFKKLSTIEKTFVVLLPIGVLAFIALWFKAMPNHDYYLTNTYISFVVIWAIGIRLFVKLEMRPWLKYSLKVIIVALILGNAVHCKNEIETRYFHWWNNSYKQYYEPLRRMKPLLNDSGISRNDTVIILGDVNPNAGLYFLDVKGWSNYGGHMDNLDSTKMANVISMGAKYMVLLDTATWQHKDFIQPYLNNELIDFENIKVYQLK